LNRLSPDDVKHAEGVDRLRAIAVHDGGTRSVRSAKTENPHASLSYVRCPAVRRHRNESARSPISTHTENLEPPTRPIRERLNDGARALIDRPIRGLVRLGVGPNTVTVGGFLIIVAACALILTEWWMPAFAVFVIGGFSDLLDGSVARLSGRVTRFGAFLDSTLDRLAEGLVLGSIGIVFARDGRWWGLGACFIALTASFLVSYTRARAEGLGITSNKGGLMGRSERLFLIGTGLFFQTWVDRFLEGTIYVLVALTVLTVVQRMVHVWRELRTPD
jgi:CDP-diacylglycerol--glycerol-3-phosphate 3-phosphatidyltransferase